MGGYDTSSRGGWVCLEGKSRVGRLVILAKNILYAIQVNARKVVGRSFAYEIR